MVYFLNSQIHYRWITSQVSQGAYYLRLLLRTLGKINMVWKVKFKRKHTGSRACLLGNQLEPCQRKRLGLETCENLLQDFIKHTLHNANTWKWAVVREAPLDYLVPGCVWHEAWTTLLYNVVVKVIRYVPIYLHAFPMIWHIPLSPCPLPVAYHHSYSRGPITHGFG